MPQYVPLGTVAAPADWVLPPSLRLSLAALYAQFDGTNAAGGFVPTVQIISDSGHTVVEVQQDSTVAAGSSVVASWAPFLKTESAASASSTSLPYGSLSQVFSGYNTSGHTQFYLTGHYLAYTNDATVFTYEDTFKALGVNVEGFYIVRATAIVFTSNTSDRDVEWEAWNGASWNGSGGGTLGPPAYIVGQPSLAAIPAGYFASYKQMYTDTFIELSLASVGAPSLPIKIRPVLNINTPPNPMTFSLNIEAFRMGDVGAYS